MQIIFAIKVIIWKIKLSNKQASEVSDQCARLLLRATKPGLVLHDYSYDLEFWWSFDTFATMTTKQIGINSP